MEDRIPNFSPALRWSLVIPPLLPAAVVLVIYGVEATGHKWNVHGDFIGMVALFILSLVVGVAAEIRALVKAVPILIKQAEERTLQNTLCTGFGLAFILFCVGVVSWLSLR